MVALILLVLVTLIGVSASNLVRNNLAVVNNLEVRERLRSVVDSAVQEVLAFGQITASPPDGFQTTDCTGDVFSLSDIAGLLDSKEDPDSPGTTVYQAIDYKCFDVTGEGATDEVAVVLKDVQCITSKPRKNSELDYTDVNEASCFNPGLYSLCADALWQVDMLAVDTLSGASIEVSQGITTLISINDASSVCN